MRPPARWIRRVLLAPLTVVIALGLVATVPLWVLVTLALSPFTSGRQRPLRLIWLATVYLLVEATMLLAMFGMWLSAGFGAGVRGPVFQRAHYRLCAWALRILYRQARWVLKLTVEIEGTAPDALPDRPLLVLSRHAGPGDSFLLAHALINWYAREPCIVLKDNLQWDPMIDVMLNRLPSRFIVPGAGQQSEQQIGNLAAGLDGDDALVIFPEGGNFTPERWERGIDRLRRLGFTRLARRAARMRNVLPPRTGGVLAALSASPQASVVLVAHTGVDHLLTIADVWRELPMDKTIAMRWWLVEPVDIPSDPDGRVDWLYAWWGRVDGWISKQKA